ncbi:MAG: hemolysin III family protein [Candidatus Pacebacteria bacterium]|nr:hemolysin III family protein [Candidatus Paceibacterota bacterium]MDD2757015.1 hemolysin III family protein [Candidatus Paceibacterota bacterium]MDD3283524.1 hemolysin III family protein [Candidatus Paceibacterota bacterium]MDD3969619.1 hemolysin III family protein [Candidatus Paceibacterota bacterium]MDD4737835.1 hemolysin III family protein [Candidatus Paceibacterota bacterium]
MKIKDPFSGFSHLLGLILSIVGTIVLVSLSSNSTQIIAFLVFGLSMIFLYTSSSTYHLFGHSPEEVDLFRKIDHAMIYILIAGTYTPFCLIALDGLWGIISMIVIWTLAILGISTVFFKSFWTKVPRWFATFLYVLMGWLSMAIIYPLYLSVGLPLIIYLLLGGLFYSVGAVIYAIKKPNIIEGFGFHEIFHIFVLLGTITHFIGIYNYLL